MKDVAQSALEFITAHKPFVMATVIRTWGSAPRKAGAHMLITEDQIVGSVSGGCLEGDISLRARGLLGWEHGALVIYGVSDSDAWNVGLSCGGEIEILLESFHAGHAGDVEYWKSVHDLIATDSEALIVHPLSGNSGQRDVFSIGALQGKDKSDWRKILSSRAHTILEEGGEKYFLEVLQPRSRLIIIGAVHIANPLVVLAKRFGFHITVIDPRGFFSEQTYFELAPDVLYTAWPAEILDQNILTQDVSVVILTHDPKIDDQALAILLDSEVGYIGALGSKKTHAKRTERLISAGFSQSQIERIHAPVGIDINAQSAEEIALSIVTELIRERNKGK